MDWSSNVIDTFDYFCGYCASYDDDDADDDDETVRCQRKQ